MGGRDGATGRAPRPRVGRYLRPTTDGASGQRPWTSTVPSPSNSAVTTGTAAVSPPENTSQPARSRSQLVGGRLIGHHHPNPNVAVLSHPPSMLAASYRWHGQSPIPVGRAVEWKQDSSHRRRQHCLTLRRSNALTSTGSPTTANLSGPAGEGSSLQPIPLARTRRRGWRRPGPRVVVLGPAGAAVAGRAGGEALVGQVLQVAAGGHP